MQRIYETLKNLPAGRLYATGLKNISSNLPKIHKQYKL